MAFAWSGFCCTDSATLSTLRASKATKSPVRLMHMSTTNKRAEQSVLHGRCAISSRPLQAMTSVLWRVMAVDLPRFRKGSKLVEGCRRSMPQKSCFASVLRICTSVLEECMSSVTMHVWRAKLRANSNLGSLKFPTETQKKIIGCVMAVPARNSSLDEHTSSMLCTLKTLLLFAGATFV